MWGSPFSVCLIFIALHVYLTSVLCACPIDKTENSTCDGIEGPLEFSEKLTATDLNQQVVRFSFMSLSCKTKNFCNITWLKDGRIPYPFGFLAGSSLYHVCLLEHNQTMEITNTQKDATGNYTCYASNSSHTIERTFHVQVKDPPTKVGILPLPDDNCANRTAPLEKDVHIFCSFCVGDKTEQTRLQWYKHGKDGRTPISSLTSSNGTDSDSRYSTFRVCGSCLDDYSGCTSVGENLTITHVTEEAYGTYELVASYTVDGVVMQNFQIVDLSPEPGPFIDVKLTVIIVVSVAMAFVLVMTVSATCYFHHLTFLLYWKNNYGAVEEEDGKQYDAFISYSYTDEDRRFVLYLRTLLHQHHYQVWMRDIDALTGEPLMAEEIDGMKASRRCILVVSPEYPQSRHSQVLTELAADQTLRQKSRIVPILYRNATKDDLRGHRELDRIVKVLPCITWEEIQEEEQEDGGEDGGEGAPMDHVEEEGHVPGDDEAHVIGEDGGVDIQRHDDDVVNGPGIGRHGNGNVNNEIKMENINNVDALREEEEDVAEQVDQRVERMQLVGGVGVAGEKGRGPQEEVMGMVEEDEVRIGMEADVDEALLGVEHEIDVDGRLALVADGDDVDDEERNPGNDVNDDRGIRVGEDGEPQQPVDPRVEHENRKRLKQRQKCEKKLLYKMPPKRPEPQALV